MSGAFSRNKGCREERKLVYELTRAGFDARRTMFQPYKNKQGESDGFDVIASKDGNTYTFEVKSNTRRFKRLYEFFREKKVGNCWRFYLGTCGIAISTDWLTFRESQFNQHFVNVDLLAERPCDRKTYNMILKLRGCLNGAQYLAIRSNNQPFLYIKYW